MQKKGANISLKGYDDIFSTDQSRAEAQQERVQEIPLSELHPFEGHPFRVVDDEEMMKTAESVRDFGVLTPAIVRPDPDGGYEIVSGHRRHRASELAGKKTMPAIVRDLDDDAAIILMVDANLQRETILPSERAYAAAKSGKNTASTTASASKGAGKATGKAAQGVKNITEKVSEFCTTHSKTILFVLIAGLLFMILSGMFSSCSAMFQGGTQIILGTSFTAKEEDIIGADNDYKALEAALRNEINNIERTHSGYDEYRYDLDEINHNPYELAAYLTVKFEDYTRDEVQAALQWLFEQQYELTLTEVVEIRTRTISSTDPETGETTTEEEDYEYYILKVKLRNKGLNSVISNSGLSEDDMERYRILLQTRGNRPDIFGNDIYATPGGEYTDYDIPGEALTDTRFANMIREAEKYLGYPYVWGGSSPSTSFDCSGFVSYVINHCGNGWSVGRLTANGLMGVCDIIPKSSAKPGDLIFFQGTYDTSGASHVGIYVGNGMMIHCGNPISYASIESNYWQQHFYCFGRIRN